MKIMKKHAVAISKMFVFMSKEGYYPMSPSEEDLISRVLSFAVYHDMVDEKELCNTKNYGGCIKIDKTARLSLTVDDLPCIMEVHKEVSEDPNLETELDEMPKAIKYLEKNLAS